MFCFFNYEKLDNICIWHQWSFSGTRAFKDTRWGTQDLRATILFTFQNAENGLVTILSVQVEEGWWSGIFNGKSGLFPSNFVKELDAMGEDGESNDTAADETGEAEATNNRASLMRRVQLGWKNTGECVQEAFLTSFSRFSVYILAINSSPVKGGAVMEPFRCDGSPGETSLNKTFGRGFSLQLDGSN